MSLVWTPEARKQLIPRKPTGIEDGKLRSVGAAWGTVRQALKHPNEVERAFVTHRPSAKPPFREWMEKCAVIATSSTMPVFDDPDVAAAFAVLVRTLTAHALVEVIYARRGWGFAFDVALRMLAMEANERPIYLKARTTTSIDADTAWRDRLLEASDAIRAECKEVAKRLWPTATLLQKTTIAYAFFEEDAWVSEACRESLEAATWSPDVLYPIVKDKDLAFELVAKRTQSRSFMELVETFGEAIVPALVEVAKSPTDSDARYAAEALAMFEDPLAATGLAALVKYAIARPWVQSYFTAHPDLADALVPEAEEKTKAGAIAKEILDGAKRARGASATTEAPLESLPDIFTNPPWRMAKRPQRPRASLSLEPIEGSTIAIAWKPGEREKALALRPTEDLPEASKENVRKHASVLKRGRAASFFVYKRELLPGASTLAVWNAGSRPYDTSHFDRFSYSLAAFGDRALEGVERLVGGLEREKGDFSLLLRVSAPRLAPAFARLQDSKSHGRFAWQWLRTHAEHAVIGLVPAALSGEDESAERALLRLAADGADILKIAKPYGDEARSALEDLLTWDLVYDVPTKTPSLGRTFKPETFTRPVTKDGKALPLDAVSSIGTMLAFTAVDPPYAGIAIVKSVCAPRSLAEFAWDVARSWEHGGHKGREKWMLMSLVHFADAEVIRRMTPGIREELAVDVLEHIDDEVALMELLTIIGRATRAEDNALVQRVETILERAALARGMEKDELEEELAPVKPIEADGTVSLDFGPRKLRVGFDEHLEPFVLDERGGRARALAPARGTDDPEHVERAKALWRDLKEDVAILALRRIAGLKRAMRSGRAWTASRFQRVWIDNGLMKHIARGIVWTDGTTAFRVAEDGSFTDSHDAKHVLAKDAQIAVLHPLRAARDELDRWRQLFADYEILQPMPQLERVALAKPEQGRGPLPFVPGEIPEFMHRMRELGFAQRWMHGKIQFRYTLPRGGVLEIDVDKDVLELALEGDPDLVDVADILDDLQRSMPSTRRSV